MILRRFYDDKLAQASYLVGCSATGEALIVDPNRDVEPYLAAAAAEGLRVSHVTETHIHADYLSGARELAHRAGARLYLSAEGGPDWSYGFAAEAGATLLRDGDSFHVGNVRIEVMHTPGHTPEHLVFVVTDTAGADRPMGVFTGDFVFVGDVGRPDLLERAARFAGTMEDGARTLFRSLRRFAAELPDYLQIWPGHGAGSACGKALGAVPQTTLGYEKLFGWAFQIEDENDFVRAVLAGQPEPPLYFAEMKRLNRDGPPLLGGFRLPPLLTDEQLADALGGGAQVVDARAGASYAEGHIPGTFSVPPGRSFPTWAGSVIGYDRPIHLIVEDEADLPELVRDLAMIGLDRVAGYATAGAVRRWAAAGRELERVTRVPADEAVRRAEAGELVVLDVRNPSEWRDGHVPGSLNLPLGRLVDRLDELPAGRTLAVHCQTGRRSGVAIGALLAHGVRDVVHLDGDYEGWSRDGRPVEREEPAVAAPAA